MAEFYQFNNDIDALAPSCYIHWLPAPYPALDIGAAGVPTRRRSRKSQAPNLVRFTPHRLG